MTPFHVLHERSKVFVSDVPHLGRFIAAAGDKSLAVRGKGHGGDTAIVPLDCPQFLTVNRIPQSDRRILAGGGNLVSIWREGHRDTFSAVALEREQFLAA